jgi:hypothetical protein
MDLGMPGPQKLPMRIGGLARPQNDPPGTPGGVGLGGGLGGLEQQWGQQVGGYPSKLFSW